VLNCSQAVYSRYENGDREPPIDALICLADFYKVSLDELVGRTVPEGTTTHGEPPPKPEGVTRVQVKLDPSMTPEERIQSLVAAMVEAELKKRGL
jgi:transcriptional regulator with XRE-family HTH domain